MQTAPQTPKRSLKHEWLPLLLTLACWGVTAWYWPHLPERIPTHWGLNGEPNQWMPLPWGALWGPAVATLMYLLLLVIPAIDPRSRNWQAILPFYHVLRSALAGFFLLMTYLSLSAAASPGKRLAYEGVIVGVGLILVILGNFLPKVRSNFFVGVRTPWTLSSDEVWERTNRLVGWLMVAGGILIALSAALPPAVSLGMVLGVALGLAAFSLIYSWWLYQRLAGPKTGQT